MNIHESQAKSIVAQFGAKVPVGFLATNEEEIRQAAKKLFNEHEAEVIAVKAQIHAGGRGKGGGVKIAKTLDEACAYAEAMLGMTLVTAQTGPEGKVVHKVYLEKGASIAKEYYLCLMIDRSISSIVIVASKEGGMDIEEVAKHSPEKIIKVAIDPAMGLQPFHLLKLTFALEIEKDKCKSFHGLVTGLYNAFLAKDASQIEINPLIETQSGEFMVLDAKMAFDSNALARHKDIIELRDFTEEDPLEIEASEFDLSYIKMDGNIGCMVNGAGLAMATMDIIKLHGKEPANFLDVGGSATKQKVKEAFKIILSDNAVKAILVNIFGGIMRCDIIADGIINAAKDIGISIPVVVRLAGTNSELGRKMLNDSGLSLIAADDLNDAATKIVATVA